MDQFWFNKMLVLSCEGPKPPNSMISGCLIPGELLFLDLIIPKYLNRYKTDYGHISKNTIFIDMNISKSKITFEKNWKRREPEHDEDPPNISWKSLI